MMTEKRKEYIKEYQKQDKIKQYKRTWQWHKRNGLEYSKKVVCKCRYCKLSTFKNSPPVDE